MVLICRLILLEFDRNVERCFNEIISLCGSRMFAYTERMALVHSKKGKKRKEREKRVYRLGVTAYARDE